jgi:DNA-binding response OmpR family regulator
LTTSPTVRSPTSDGWRPRFLLLIADPALDTAHTVVSQLTRQHVQVELCSTAAEALVAAGAMRPDALLIAAELGDLPSTEVVRALAKRTQIPVIVGIGDDQGGRAGEVLAAGATACVARPYRLNEIVSIMRSIRPDALGTSDQPIELGGIQLDPRTLEVVVRGTPTRLVLREYQLLRFLMLHADRIVTREEIYETVWGEPARDASNTLTVHIGRLRSKIGDDQKRPHIILTLRGIGYRFVAPPEPVRKPRR